MPVDHRELERVGQPHAGGVARLLVPAVLDDGEGDDDRRGADDGRGSPEARVERQLDHERHGLNL